MAVKLGAGVSVGGVEREGEGLASGVSVRQVVSEGEEVVVERLDG